MKYQELTYLRYNPFEGADRDVEIREYTWKLVKTRKPHDCMLAELVGKEQHAIEVGKSAMREHAIVEGEWGSSYCCLDCMDKWIAEELEPLGYDVDIIMAPAAAGKR